jgi:hypothetical protein
VRCSTIGVLAAAMVVFASTGEAEAQEREVGPCGGTSVTPSGRSYKCSPDKKPVCNVKTSVCYCATRPECRRRS